MYIMDGLCLKAGLMPAPITISDVRATVTAARKPFSPPWGFSFKYPLRSLWGKRFDAIAADDAVSVENEEKNGEGSGRNWVLRILHFRSLRSDLEGSENVVEEREVESEGNNCDHDEECDVCDDDDEKVVFDKESFGKMLRRVTLGEARLYAQLSYLGSLAYSIPQIKVPHALLFEYWVYFLYVCRF